MIRLFRLGACALALLLLTGLLLAPSARAASRGSDATGPPPAFEVRIWRSVADPDRVYYSARPRDGSWAVRGTVSLPLDRLSRSGHYRFGDFSLGTAPGAPAIEVRIWQSVAGPRVLHISARASNGSWRAFGTRPLHMSGVSSSGLYRYAHFTLDFGRLPLDEAIGQMLLVGFRGVALDDESRRMLSDMKPGGIILYDYDGPSGGADDRNITGPEQLIALTAELQGASATPLFIAIDAEGGFVHRLKEQDGFPLVVPSAQTLGEGSPEDTAAIASALAAELRAYGINWNLAPVVDVNIDPESPAIGYWERSFSADPAVVAAHARAFVEAHRDHNVITALKHFPGHGSAAGDTHIGVTDVTATYQRDDELAPYRQLIADGYDSPIMTAHVVNRNLDESARPATLSRPIMIDLLRGELGFEGLVLSDDMQMGAIVAEYGLEEAAVEAVRAGVDIIMLTNQHSPYDLGVITRVRDALLRAVASGLIAEDRIYESVERITALKRQYGLIE